MLVLSERRLNPHENITTAFISDEKMLLLAENIEKA